MDGHFDGRHVALGDPVEAVDVVEQTSFDLLDGCAVQQFLFDHVEAPS
jgi:hypothetical protein